MVSDKVPFSEFESKNIEDKMMLFNRANKLMERALKLIKQGEGEKDENTKS